MALSSELTALGYRSARVYTPAMRFPRMVGKGFHGEPLPGGPYTVAQFVGGGLIFGLSGISAYLAPIINPLINLVAGACLTVVVGGLLTNVPVDGIKLGTRLVWMLGLLASTAPTASELMPTSNPVVVVGGEVLVIDPPRRSATPRPCPRPGGVAPTTRGTPAAPASSGATGTPPPQRAGTQIPADPSAAAAVFAALTATVRR